MRFITQTALVASAGIYSAYAQSTIGGVSCSPTFTATYPTPSVADGYVARLVANNLTDPRDIIFDSRGNLLVVEQEVGITALSLVDAGGGCLSVGTRTTVIADTSLNHGIELSNNGSVLYASNSDSVYAWQYDASTTSNTSEPAVLITGMNNSDHTTRTLLLSQHAPGLLVVTRGSTSNLDLLALDVESGHSQVKAFNISNMTGTDPYDFNTAGLMLAWGVRNDVGIDEEPLTGGIYTVENSVDQMVRQGRDIHENNPAEELNFMGYLNGTESAAQGANFGYPECYAAWTPSVIPEFDGGEVGQQFAIGDLNATNNDTVCAAREAPRLSFEAHLAPLDLLFNPTGTAAWVTFHGSWNRDSPAGYKLSVIPFAAGEPTAPSNSTAGYIDILANQDNSRCPDECFRPVGLAWDGEGRLFMSSDSTGEIYVVQRADGSSMQDVGSNATGTLPGYSSENGTGPDAGTGTNTTGGESPSETGAAAVTSVVDCWAALAVGFGALAFFL